MHLVLLPVDGIIVHVLPTASHILYNPILTNIAEDGILGKLRFSVLPCRQLVAPCGQIARPSPRSRTLPAWGHCHVALQVYSLERLCQHLAKLDRE